MRTPPHYVVVTPVRNESEYLPMTIDSVLSQSVRPLAWIIVDDGSNDGTVDIVQEAAAKTGWVILVRRKDRGFRKAGGGVVDAFYDGFSMVRDKKWDYIVKLDGDLSFRPTYFERCLEKFANDGTLGIGGGEVYHSMPGGLHLERQPRFHVRGASKIYRRECWQAIGGLIHAPGWDTLDEVKANMLGWSTRSFPELILTHHRFTGAAAGSWRNSLKCGFANYVSGYHPLFMIVKCGCRVFRRPFFMDALGQMCGFLKGYLTRTERYGEKDVIRYLRTQQMNRLLFRKSIWR